MLSRCQVARLTGKTQNIKPIGGNACLYSMRDMMNAKSVVQALDGYILSGTVQN